MNYQGTTLRVTSLDSGLLELCFDLQGESVNKFNQATLRELREVVEQMAQNPEIRGLLVTSAKDVFIVGADITEFLSSFQMPQDELQQWVMKAQQVFTDLENLDFPKVVAINGYALGGGFEMALACSLRVMSSKARVGQPEVKLGLIPGFGGTSRLPRLIGVDNALEWMAAGGEYKGEAALQHGAVDAVVEPENLRDAALTLLNRALCGEIDWQQRREEIRGPLQLNENEALMAFETARAFIASKAGKHYPAPLSVVGVVQACAPMSLVDALAVEAEAFAELAKTDVATSLVGIFLGDQQVKKLAKSHARKGQPVARAGVLGAGIMGGGVAYQSAYKKVPIVMKDIAQGQLDLGMNEASKILQKGINRGKTTPGQMAETLTRIMPTLDYAPLKEVDLIVEAVVEKESVKRQVYQELAAMVGPETVIASNTSTISISKLAQGVPNPERFCGMHFFNPVHRMPLVEVIRGEQTSEETIARTVSYALAMGKSPIVVNDCPGFLVNRVLFPYFAGFNGLVQDGVDFERIDKVMEKQFGWPMGPAFLLDVVGIDTACHAEGVMAEGFPERMQSETQTIAQFMYEQGRFGQKNNLGFYTHSTDRKGKPVKVRAEDIDERLQSFVQGDGSGVSDEDIINRLMLPMLTESSRCLEDNIVGTPAELDMGLVYGLGFPPFRGGIFRWVDATGIDEILRRLEQYGALGALYAPTEQLRALATSGGKFYPLS
ncbi:MAG: fatty acid oxidation complex subunit alpha FadB [bacterium]